MKVIKVVKTNIETNKKIRIAELLIVILLMIASLFCFIKGFKELNLNNQEVKYIGQVVMYRDETLEDYDEDNTACDVTYKSGSDSLIVTYTYDEYLKVNKNTIDAYKFITEEGVNLFFLNNNPTKIEINNAYKTLRANQMMPIFNLAISLLVLVLSVLLIMLFSKSFTLYEKCWFLSIMILATIFSYFFPEESANGVNGIVIMVLYLLDTFFNILCELLISKQSRYNFLVSIVVEILEILICVVLMYRFATLAVTLFFWLPIDIVSFINWSKHKDEEKDELTIVRKLKGYQELLIILAVVVWTIVVGYILSGINIVTDFFHGDEQLKTIIAYLDACASAVGVANGLFIFFRLQEQWIAWYLNAALETIINILSGQYVLLVLKFGYFTNTTYGYIKWNRYIKEHKEVSKTLF